MDTQEVREHYYGPNGMPPGETSLPSIKTQLSAIFTREALARSKQRPIVKNHLLLFGFNIKQAHVGSSSF
jgi:hypothetical protein